LLASPSWHTAHGSRIRIHQLTLPESLPFAHKLVHDVSPAHHGPVQGYTLGESSRLSTSPDRLRRPSQKTERERRGSDTETETRSRHRSGSTSTITIGPPSPAVRVRTTRPRAPTLAGEAIEHKEHPEEWQWTKEHESLQSVQEVTVPGRLVRCFVLFKLSNRPVAAAAPGTPKVERSAPSPARTASYDVSGSQGRTPTRGTGTRAESSTSMHSPTPSPKLSARSTISRSSLSRVASADSPARQRTVSLGSPSRKDAAPLVFHRKASQTTILKSDLVAPPESLLLTSGVSADSMKRTPNSDKKKSLTATYPDVPFYISPIHHPSRYPRFLNLNVETDFASWLTVEQFAGTSFRMEIWYEAVESDESGGPGQWTRLSTVDFDIDLSNLRKKEKTTVLASNALEFTLASDPKAIFYLPENDQSTLEDDSPSKKKRQNLQGIVERSMRESKMRKGVGVGDLHQ
jgi:hypothetical protein